MLLKLTLLVCNKMMVLVLVWRLRFLMMVTCTVRLLLIKFHDSALVVMWVVMHTLIAIRLLLHLHRGFLTLLLVVPLLGCHYHV